MKAPIKVINELDNTHEYTPYGLLDAIIRNLDTQFETLSNTKVWYRDMQEKEIEEVTLNVQQAIINHVFGNERLQPEREPRYYVEFYDYNGDRTLVYKVEAYLPVDLDADSSYIPKYEEGLDHATAEKAQALYGGTIEEIN